MAAFSSPTRRRLPTSWARVQLLLVVFIAVVSHLVPLVDAVMPDSQIRLQYSSDGATTAVTTTTLLASNAFFGPTAPVVGKSSSSSSLHYYPLAHLGDDHENALFCNIPTENEEDATAANEGTTTAYDNAVWLIPRGNCTYQRKTYIAQQYYHAQGVILYNTLKSRYDWNDTTSQILWPLDKHDYDCDYGQAYIPVTAFSSDESSSSWNTTPYDSSWDTLLSGNDENSSNNLCRQYATAKNGAEGDYNSCASDRCYLTGNYSSSTTTTTNLQACCAWDQHLYLYSDTTTTLGIDISIPTVMVTMEQGATLLRLWETATTTNTGQVQVSLQSRWKLDWNLSALLIWMLGVGVCALAAYLSASDYHKALRQRTFVRAARGRSQGPSQPASTVTTTTPIPRSALQEETLELEPIHAIGFIIMASSSLIILFYFEIYGIVKVFYAFGCSNAVIQVLLIPMLERIWQALRLRKFMVYVAEMPVAGEEEPLIPSLSNVDVLAMVLGYMWGAIWLYMAFTMPPHNPATSVSVPSFFWVSQNIFGTCMCCLFLQIIQMNTIQVATILLVVAFCYDIFFVFVTPYLTSGGESIMITVATSGGPPKAGVLWCEHYYATDPNCQGGDPLPMLLTMPRFFDYQGGSSLLGLGDIVLPGLLLSFGARLDAAKALVAIDAGTGDSRRSGTYFGPLVAAYAIGLCMANVAVYVMNMGQPALLYLVPCCLGTMTFLGYRRNELSQLWHGPTVLAAADRIAYGNNRSSPSPGQSSQPEGNASANAQDGGGTIVELSPKISHGSENDDELGRVPLLEAQTTATSFDKHEIS